MKKPENDPEVLKAPAYEVRHPDYNFGFQFTGQDMQDSFDKIDNQSPVEAIAVMIMFDHLRIMIETRPELLELSAQGMLGLQSVLVKSILGYIEANVQFVEAPEDGENGR